MSVFDIQGYSVVNILSAEHSMDHYAGSKEPLSAGMRVGDLLGLSRLGIHSEILSPGRRTSFPHAESENEEFVLVIAGAPTLWVDGCTRPLQAGDAIGFPPGTGLCHTFLNETSEDVRLLVIGERSPNNKTFYCCDSPDLQPDRLWESPPDRHRGPHDGRPGPQR